MDSNVSSTACAVVPARVPASGGLSLTRNFTWTFCGNVLAALCQWGILVAIAKCGPPAIVGQFALALAVTAPVLLLTNQAMRALQASDVTERISFNAYVGYRVISTGAAFLLIAAAARMFPYARLIELVGIAKCLDSGSDILYGYYQHRSRMDLIATSMISKGLLSVTAAWALVWATRQVEWAAAGLVLSSASVFLLYDCRMAVRLLRSDPGDPWVGHSRSWWSLLKPAFPPRMMAALGRLGWPLGLSAMTNSLCTNVPRYFLERHSGAAALGIFAACAYLMVAGNTVVNALSEASLARLANLHNYEGRRRFRSFLLRLAAIGAGLGVAGILVALLLGRFVLRLIYGPVYAQRSDVLVMVMIAAAFSYVGAFGGTALTAVRAIRVQPVILGVSIAVAVATCALAIPSLGIRGAALAMISAAAVQTGMTYLALHAAVRRRPL